MLERRHGGDPEDLKAPLDFLAPVRNRVLAKTLRSRVERPCSTSGLATAL